MYNKNTKGNVLIYSLVLVNLALLLALAMFNNFFVFINNTEGSNIDRKLSNNILEKGALFAKYARTLNSNGSGIVDLIGCPNSVTMSGDTLVSTTNTSLVHYNGGVYCGGTHNGTGYYVYFNQDFTGFSGAIYYGDAVNVSASGLASRDFIDYDNTVINISGGLPTSPDGMDDDFNSDNYSISASGALMYPGTYIDDDALARTSIYGYISPQSEYSNIFWSNTKVQNYIDANPNNTGNYFDRLSNLSSGILYMDIDRDFDLKILQLDKNSYDTTKELIVQSKTETTGNVAAIGYIQNNAGVLSLSPTITGNEYNFDFTTNDYALFINNTGTGVLTYSLLGENASGSGVYLNAVDDSGAGSIKYLGADIIQDGEKNYIGKIFEVTNKK